MSIGGRGASIPLRAGLIALLALAVGAAPATAAKPPRVGGCAVFPAFKGSPTAASAANQTAWNQDVSKAPVDPRSGAYIRRITRLGGNQFVHPDFGGNGRYGIPYNVVGRHQRRVRVHVTAYPGESDFGRAPIPPHARVESGSDRHVLVVQRGRCDLFEMFGARYVGGEGHRWNAASTAKFDLHSTKLRHDGWTLRRGRGAADPARPRPLRRGQARPRAPRDPRHLLRDAQGVHPPPPPTTPHPSARAICRRWGCACACARATTRTTFTGSRGEASRA